MNGAVPPLSLYVFMMCIRKVLVFVYFVILILLFCQISRRHHYFTYRPVQVTLTTLPYFPLLWLVHHSLAHSTPPPFHLFFTHFVNPVLGTFTSRWEKPLFPSPCLSVRTQLDLHTGDFPLKKQYKFAIDCKSVSTIQQKRHAAVQLAEALRYKPVGRGFDFRWCHWNFALI